MKVWLDLETRSEVDLEECGLDNYAKSKSTEVILAAYAFGDGAVRQWSPHLNPTMPSDLRLALEDCWTEVWAWNASFERTIVREVLGIDKPICEWKDPMAMARYLSMPGSLEAVGEILGLGEDEAKMKEGSGLVRKFCVPETYGGRETLFGTSSATFRDWRTDPEDWKLFAEYNKRDVVSEQAIYKKMLRLPQMPESEWEIWILDQIINDTGWPTDMPLVNGARFLVQKEQEPLLERIRRITSISNPNSREQLLRWLSTQGYDFSSLKKDFVKRAVDGECVLTPAAREVIEIRSQTSKSSVSKYTAVADLSSEDGRLRHQYTYYGARTGRWTAQGVNVANLPKPSKDVEKRLELAIDLVREMDYEGVVREFGKPLEVASSVIRSAFRAPEGWRFVVADLNAIENRGLGYVARCDSILEVFRSGSDPYLSFAVKMFGMTYEDLLAEYKAGNKDKRNICKAPVLGAGYQLSAGEEYVDDEGNKVWSGLMGYARAMGVEMSKEDAEYAIRVFRESYPEVKRLWKDMERASVYAIRHPGQLVGVGVPQTERDKAYFEEIGRPVLDPIISFVCTGKSVLEMALPSGRSLCYLDPHVESEEKEYQGRKYTQDVVYHKNRDQKTKQWVDVSTFGGRWVENADQAVSRDVLVNGMKLAHKRGFQIVGNTYDEIIALAPLHSDLTEKVLCQCMAEPPSWCGSSFPLGAEGFESEVYRKG